MKPKLIRQKVSTDQMDRILFKHAINSEEFTQDTPVCRSYKEILNKGKVPVKIQMYRDFFSNENEMNQRENPYNSNNKTKNEYKTIDKI